MKTIKQLVAKKGLFYGAFNNKESVAREFNEELGDNVNILFAWYDHYGYEGYAEVIFEQDGVLYEVSGSHCSCFGLEGQWEPQTLELKEIQNRVTKGTFGEYGGFKEPLKKFLGVK